MNIEQEIDAIFNNHNTSSGFDPSRCAEELASYLREQCSEEKKLDPRDHQKAQNACNQYGGIAKIFHDLGYWSAAEFLLIQGWNDFSQIQFECRNKIYKAAIAWYLSTLYLRRNDRGASLRWALLGQADDALESHTTGGNQKILSDVLGLSDSILNRFNSVAEENLQATMTDWSQSAGFPEDVLTRFALKYPELANSLNEPTGESGFPLSPPYCRSLMIQLDTDESNDKGNALENLASYLFLLIPNCFPRRNMQDSQQSFENDIVVSDLSVASNLRSELLGRDFLVECKNWKNRVGVNQVGYFLYRMHLTHCRFGIIFASQGITGEKNEAEKIAAHSLINKSFHEDGIIAVVINRSELEELAIEQRLFWPMIVEKTKLARFGKSKYSDFSLL